jgi:hypothetical protein
VYIFCIDSGSAVASLRRAALSQGQTRKGLSVSKPAFCHHAGPTLFVAELQLDHGKDPRCLGVFFSLAGRESVLGLHAPLVSGRIDTRVLDDLLNRFNQQMTHSIEHMIGIQGVLPMV